MRELFFVTEDFPLLAQYKELVCIIRTLQEAFQSRELGQILEQREPDTAGQLYEQLFRSHEQFALYCRQVLNISDGSFLIDSLLKSDLKQMQLQHITAQIAQNEQKTAQLAKGAAEQKAQLEEMYEQLLMSVDYLDAEIQIGGNQQGQTTKAEQYVENW